MQYKSTQVSNWKELEEYYVKLERCEVPIIFAIRGKETEEVNGETKIKKIDSIFFSELRSDKGDKFGMIITEMCNHDIVGVKRK